MIILQYIQYLFMNTETELFVESFEGLEALTQFSYNIFYDILFARLLIDNILTLRYNQRTIVVI